jgi:protoheme IX farnesyltransferase
MKYFFNRGLIRIPEPLKVGRVILDYLTLMKPSIVLLLLVTALPAMVLAEDGWPGWALVSSTLLGLILSAGGAAAINMAADAKIDALMERTKSRPIPRGTITPRNAVIYGLLLGLLAGIWLWWTVNVLSMALALFAFFYYGVVYSLFLKRKTVHNTVLGGIAGSLPVLIGWTAVTNGINPTGLLLFIIVFCWQPPHFWALSLGLVSDYAAAKIPMAPNVIGSELTKRQMVVWSSLTLLSSILFTFVASMGWFYFAVAFITGLGFLYISLRLTRQTDSRGARGMFRYSTIYLTLLFAAMVVDQLLLS